MITFKDVIDKVDFDCVWKEYLVYYPDMSRLRKEFFQVFNTLLCKEPKENTKKMVIHIDRQDHAENFQIDDGETKGLNYEVHGKCDSDEWNGYWDISVADWGSWLGYYIHDEVTNFLSIEQVVALCLYEMTWHGLSEQEIINWVNSIDKDYEDQV